MVNSKHCLVITYADGEMDYFLLEPDVIAIGRGPKNSIVLDAETVSVWHCEIRRKRGRFEICDMGSTNGTKLNRQALGEEPMELREGDSLQIGLDVKGKFVALKEIEGAKPPGFDSPGELTKKLSGPGPAARPSINPVAAAVARASKGNK
ncbi:MAG: FHA domain-containing protein [Verrucomicrobiales bacterium]|nr:FHA domain-containing protein [Verrucomicrobiales bacterium]